MKKVLLITNIPTPYRIPLFNLLQEEMKKEGWQLHVVFSSKGYKRRQFQIDEGEFNFPYTILDGGKLSVGKDAEKTFFFYKGLWKVLREYKPWRIISSGFSPASILCAIHNLIHGTPFLIWSGTIESGERRTPWWRKIIRKALLHRAAAFICYGSKAADYLAGLGAERTHIHIAINTVDTRFFREKTQSLRTGSMENKLFQFTCLGYLVPRKNVHKVIDAVEQLSKKRNDFHLTIIGDGISRAELEKKVQTQNLNTFITFTGYKQKAEIPSYLAQTNVLLFQTDFDIWGLVLNEAMAAGVVCLASPNAGAVYDLIQDGENGFIVDFDSLSHVTEKMDWMINHQNELKRIGLNAADFILKNAGLEQSVNGFIKAVKNS